MSKLIKIIATVLIAGQLAIPTFADTTGTSLSPPEFSVVIGGNVYTLDYANNPVNQSVISDAIVNIGNGKVYVQTVKDNWTDNETRMTLGGTGKNNIIVTSVNGSSVASETISIPNGLVTEPMKPIVTSVFDSKNISAMCNYNDLLVKGSDIKLKDYDDFGKTTVKPTYTIPTAYMPNLNTNYYSIANAIINPQMYTSLGYGDKKRRVRDYDRVVLDYSETKEIGLTNFAFIYEFYTDNEPYNDCQKTSFAGLKPIGDSLIGTQFLDTASISSFYKTNKILFGDQGDSISDDITNNYKLHANDNKQFSTQKDFGKIRVNVQYSKDEVLVTFFEIVASQEVEIAPMIANPVTAEDKNEEKTFEIYKAAIFKGIAEKKTSITIDYSGGMEGESRDTDMAVVGYILKAIYANPHETIGFSSYGTNGSMTSMYITLGYRY